MVLVFGSCPFGYLLKWSVLMPFGLEMVPTYVSGQGI